MLPQQLVFVAYEKYALQNSGSEKKKKMMKASAAEVERVSCFICEEITGEVCQGQGQQHFHLKAITTAHMPSAGHCENCLTNLSITIIKLNKHKLLGECLKLAADCSPTRGSQRMPFRDEAAAGVDHKPPSICVVSSIN